MKQRPCVCGHAPVHHDKRKSIPQGLMADYKVIYACGWTGCGCPRYVEQPEPQRNDLQQRIDRVLALCGDADTGWPAMVAKILRGEPGAPAYFHGGLRRFCHGSKGGWQLPPPEVIKADPTTCPHAVLDEMAGVAWGYEDCVTCGKRFPMGSDW